MLPNLSLHVECCALWGERELSGRVLARAGIGRAELAVRNNYVSMQL